MMPRMHSRSRCFSLNLSLRHVIDCSWPVFAGAMEQAKASQQLQKTKFRYHHLPLSDQRIRVLRLGPDLTADGLIQCQLSEDDVSSEHVCLSYMWGLERPKKAICVNGQSFFVRLNLWKFLRLSRERKETRPLWIDAICIDQGNKKERGHQVRLMGQIYNTASQVLVWLGKGDVGVELALGMLGEMDIVDSHERIESRERDFCSRLAQNGICRSDVKSFSQAIERLCSLPYWDRIWIKQEVILNLNLRFLYGQAICHGLADTLCLCKDSNSWCGRHKTWAIKQSICSATLGIGITRLQDLGAAGPDQLQDLIIKFSDSACSDPRDRVYALLSMSKEKDALDVDYGIAEVELFVRTVSIIRFREKPRGPPVLSQRFWQLQTRDLAFFCSLVEGLRLTWFILQEYDLQHWQAKSGILDWSLEFDLKPLALFKGSHVEQDLLMDAEELCQIYGVPADKAASKSTYQDEVFSRLSDGNPRIEGSRRFITRVGNRFASGEVLLESSYIPGLLLIGRFGLNQNDDFEITAIAKCFHQSKDLLSIPMKFKSYSTKAFEIFDLPRSIFVKVSFGITACTSGQEYTSIEYTNASNEASMTFNLASISLLASLLHADLSQSSKPTWSWTDWVKGGKMRQCLFARLRPTKEKTNKPRLMTV